MQTMSSVHVCVDVRRTLRNPLVSAALLVFGVVRVPITLPRRTTHCISSPKPGCNLGNATAAWADFCNSNTERMVLFMTPRLIL